MGKLFSEVHGQRPAIKILSSQLLSGNFSHAYLFLGEEGIGKTFLANQFSRYILCEDLNEKPKCESCKKIQFDSHPDFIRIDGEEGIKIEQIREAISRINLSPALSSYKVLLISHAENMGNEAANALLKTLEEPPIDSVIVLTAISEKSLPQTIVSRVQKVKLLPLGNSEILEILKSECDEETAKKITAITGGNIGEAKEVLDNLELLNSRQLVFDDVARLFSSSSVIEKFKIIEDYEKKKALKDLFKVLTLMTAHSIKDEIMGGERVYDFGLGLTEKVRLMEKILKIYEELEYNVNLRLALEEMVLDKESLLKTEN